MSIYLSLADTYNGRVYSAAMTEHIGDRIFRLRTERRWNQTELAKRSGIDQPRIPQYELKHKIPSTETQRKLALGFGISFSEFTDGADLSKPSQTGGMTEEENSKVGVTNVRSKRYSELPNQPSRSAKQRGAHRATQKPDTGGGENTGDPFSALELSTNPRQFINALLKKAADFREQRERVFGELDQLLKGVDLVGTALLGGSLSLPIAEPARNDQPVRSPRKHPRGKAPRKAS